MSLSCIIFPVNVQKLKLKLIAKPVYIENLSQPANSEWNFFFRVRPFVSIVLAKDGVIIISKFVIPFLILS